MGIIFKLFLAYDNRYGMMPRLIKTLRASGIPEDLKAADALQATLDERKRNPPKSLNDMTSKALAKAQQVSRDMRVEGRHGEAEQFSKVIDYTEKNMMSKQKPKRPR
ncbi:hypothetical protein [Janthinobacterium sp. MDT1-19]|uniref:hypothetical protein n=1 Tax=Janthinobacterium sp. MDT1-19 TaxID=1259339 RepID=UPI003F280372